MIALAFALAVQDTSRLTIVAASRAALAQFPTVAAARASVARAGADVRETKSQQLPHLLLDAQANQWQLPAIAFPLHGIPSAPNTPPPGGPLVFDNTTYQGAATLNWTFFDFGARGGRTRATRALEDAATSALGSAEQSLVARTAGVYLRTLSARQVLAAQDRRIAALEAEADRTRRMLAEGKIARIEVLRADAALARARAERSATSGQLDVAEHELSQLTARPWEAVTRDSLQAVQLREPTNADALRTGRSGIVAQALAGNADAAEARHRAQAAHVAAAAARATRYPELRANATYIARAAGTGEVRPEWQAGVGISYPLYTGGQRGGAIERAGADEAAAAEQLRLTEVNVTQGVDRAIASVIETHARVLALISAVDQSVAVADIERTSLDVGSGTQTDYLEALTLALQSRSQLIEARHAEIAARIELARVTGELSPDWLATHLELVP